MKKKDAVINEGYVEGKGDGVKGVEVAYTIPGRISWLIRVIRRSDLFLQPTF